MWHYMSANPSVMPKSNPEGVHRVVTSNGGRGEEITSRGVDLNVVGGGGQIYSPSPLATPFLSLLVIKCDCCS